MTSFRSVVAMGLGMAAIGWALIQPASAQYYGGPGYDRPYERRYGDGYDRRGYGRDDDRRGWRDDRGGGYDRGYGRRSQDPMAGMTMEERKRAIKNERNAQKKAFKQQQFHRGLLGQ